MAVRLHPRHQSPAAGVNRRRARRPPLQFITRRAGKQPAAHRRLEDGVARRRNSIGFRTMPSKSRNTGRSRGWVLAAKTRAADLVRLVRLLGLYDSTNAQRAGRGRTTRLNKNRLLSLPRPALATPAPAWLKIIRTWPWKEAFPGLLAAAWCALPAPADHHHPAPPPRKMGRPAAVGAVPSLAHRRHRHPHTKSRINIIAATGTLNQ